MAGTCGSSLVVNLPGSPKGAVENLTALLPVLPHALTLLAGDTEHRRPPSS
jgi:molybdopterin biosynthesis enzyme MoaB